MPSEIAAMNTTTMALSGIGGDASWFSLLVIVILITVTGLLFAIALSSITRYKKIKGIIYWFGNTLIYFFFGIGTLGVLAIPVLITLYFSFQASQGNTVPIWITATIIGVYFFIVGIGYIAKHLIVDRIKLFEVEIQEKEKE